MGLMIMEVGTWKIIHFNVTDHPTAERTLQQFREVIRGDEGQGYLTFVTSPAFRLFLYMAILYRMKI